MDINIESFADFSKPCSEVSVRIYLEKENLREDFLLNYTFFKVDGNKKIYENWIFENLGKKKNVLLEDVYRLAGNVGIYDGLLLERAETILKGNYFQFTKLAVLEYLFDQAKKTPRKKYFSLAKIAFLHTKNQIVRFQSFLNILRLGITHKSYNYIEKILSSTGYPTLYYRILNQIQDFSGLIRKELINLIINNLDERPFSEEVKREIRGRVNRIRNSNKV